MTPHVLDDMGDRLAAAAVETSCGARFTGAGGGGCMWALGEAGNIARLRSKWAKHLAARPSAGLLDCRVDNQGVIAG
jgi:D-glycero-alpha-D-manno-heptose-7-phosphate kinase